MEIARELSGSAEDLLHHACVLRIEWSFIISIIVIVVAGLAAAVEGSRF
jgi:hypothetical protein